MRIWLAILLIALGIVAAKAIPVEQQIIIFGGQSSASGGGGTGTDLLANTGQPIYSTGTTPILVQ
jgi:hypothetical protein